MAAGNPSTIGTGTEVLRRRFVHENNNTSTALITGVADHIYTVISVVVCEMAGADETFSLYIDPDTGTDNVNLLNEQPLSGKATFVFSDKVVIANTDVFYVWSSAGNIDVYCTYIDQNWT